MLIYLPLTPQSDKGRMRYITIKGDSLSKIVLEDCSISFIVGVDVQDMLACRPTHFAGTETKRKTKVLTRLSLFSQKVLSLSFPIRSLSIS